MLQSEYATGQAVAPTPCDAGEQNSFRATIALTAAQVIAGQIIEMGPLPANCDLVDAILDTDELDTGTDTITLDVGVMSGTFGVNDGARTCGAEVISASIIGRTGGVVRPTLATAFRIARSDTDRGIGVKVNAGPNVAAAGTVGLTLIYRG